MLGMYLISRIIASFDYSKIQNQRTFGFNYSNNLKTLLGFMKELAKKKKRRLFGWVIWLFLRIMVIYKNQMFHFWYPWLYIKTNCLNFFFIIMVINSNAWRDAWHVFGAICNICPKLDNTWSCGVKDSSLLSWMSCIIYCFFMCHFAIFIIFFHFQVFLRSSFFCFFWQV